MLELGFILCMMVSSYLAGKPDEDTDAINVLDQDASAEPFSVQR